MAITLISSITIAGAAGNTAYVNTTGANLIVVSVSSYSGSTAPTVSDLDSNVYVPLTVRTTGNIRQRIYYCSTIITGYPSHGVSVTGISSYTAFTAYTFSGVASYQTESGTTGTSSTSLASGSVTPSINGALIVTGVAGDTTVTDSISGGFTSTGLPYTGGGNMQGSAAYLIQTTATAINPTWSFSPAQTSIAVSSAVFLPTVSVGTSSERTSLSVSLG